MAPLSYMSRKVRVRFDREGNPIEVQVKSDLSPFVRAAQFERKENPDGWTRKRSLRKVASIPLDIVMSLPPEEQRALMYGSKRALRKVLEKYPIFKTEGSF